MSPELAVGLGAVLGAPARYLLDAGVLRRTGQRLPWGILVVNLTGSLAAGLLLGLGPPAQLRTLVGVGLLGSFTTASTLAWDVLALERTPRLAALLLALHIVPGVLLAALGLVLGRAVS